MLSPFDRLTTDVYDILTIDVSVAHNRVDLDILGLDYGKYGYILYIDEIDAPALLLHYYLRINDINADPLDFVVSGGFGYHFIHRIYFTNTITTPGNVFLQISGVSKKLVEEDLKFKEGLWKLLKI